ncbi:MAG: sulfatase/phosphatase domain-containing protein, partial [Bacillota bacterium]
RKRNWKLVADDRYKLINYQDKKKNQLFDLETDPEQNNPIEDESVEKKMIAHLKRLMKESDSPEEQYQRLDL